MKPEDSYISVISEYCRYLINYQIIKNEVTRYSEKYNRDECFYTSRDVGIHLSIFDATILSPVWGVRSTNQKSGENARPEVK